MKNSGFTSIYALLFLELSIAFCVTVITAAAAAAQSDPQAPLFEAQIFAIYHIKARMKETEELPSDSLVNQENEESENETFGFMITSEVLNYEGITIEIQYENDEAMVHFQDIRLQIQCDLTHKRIMDLVYLSE